ncbi:MAG: tRNA 4-thiouridine(8) synthase ThiI [Clostridiales bacterium]|nr:tRNA 4-thiouridine(8) synthase ThiI [Clostridiales bacterium]
MTKALALTSGGLDSILAAKLVANQGIEVTGICFASAFFGSRNAEKMAEQIGMPLIIIDFTKEHLKMTKDPKHGYGKNMNPCIDCHAMMLNYAGKYMEEHGYDFLITGEVLNQRPMSQNIQSLNIVKKESGYEDKILRPLSALKLPPTQMELDGIVDRTKLLGFSGKTRKPQIQLAEEMGIVEYPSPAGGCFLTEPNFGRRLKDLYEHGKEEADVNDVKLLDIGRHFRLTENAKAVSTRNKDEYDKLKDYITEDMWVFDTAEHKGSTVLLKTSSGYEPTEDEIYLTASITARYSKGKDEEEVSVKYKRLDEVKYEFVNVKPAEDEDIKEYML